MRKAIYFLIGILSAAIIFIYMLTNSPKVEMVGSSLADFHLIKNDDGNNQRIEEVNGTYSNFLENGSYHVDEFDHEYYISSGVVKHGKGNPMFYFVKTAPKPSTTIDKVIDEVTGAIDSIVGGSTSTDSKNDSKENESSNVGGVEKNEAETGPIPDLTKPNVVKGFNVTTNVYEDKDITPALNTFKENGKLPIDETFYGVTSLFGERIDPFNQQKAVHTGLDLATPGINKQNVYSADNGEIVAIKKGNKGYGNHVIVKHDGYETLYGHLSSIGDIKVGQKIQAGTIIGKIGSTGRSTSPHLHFEVRIDNVTVDPKPFINLVRSIIRN